MKTDLVPIPSALPARLEALGLDPRSVLHRAGLPAALFGQSKVRVTTQQFFAFWRALEEVTGDPAFGLRLGSHVPKGQYDIASLAALHSANFGEAMRKLGRYKRLVCPEEVTIEVHKGEARVRYRWMLAEANAPTLLVDAMFASGLSLARQGTGKALTPRRIELTRRADHEAMLTRHFGCAIQFNAPLDLLIFDESTLAEPFITHHADLLALLVPGLEAALAEVAAEPALPAQVSEIVSRSMRGQRPSVEDVARELGLSPRTLQRRLAEAGTSYQRVLDQVRKEAARRLLSNTDLDASEIAFFLGFEELNSFTRAFHGWEGTTPGRWRAAAGH